MFKNIFFCTFSTFKKINFLFVFIEGKHKVIVVYIEDRILKR
jgi:hypothetical protein